MATTNTYFKKLRLFLSINLTLLLFVPGGLSAQNCTCVQNQDFNCIDNSGNMNSSFGTTVNDWSVSHGSPSIFSSEPPPAVNQRSIWMWSARNRGEGIFTCYNFQQGQSYQVCFWIRTNNKLGNGGLSVQATNSLSAVASSNNFNIPNPASQWIADDKTQRLNWTLVSYNFTASGNYNQLWIHPRRYNGTITTDQLEIQVDRVVVTPIAQSNPNLTISASPSTISWCQSSTLSVGNVPLGATVRWSPATGLSSTLGTTVTASPCATTTYTATIEYGNECGSCPSNIPPITQTVFVNPPAFTINAPAQVPCGQTLNISASPLLTCPGIVYEWTLPNGSITYGSGFSIPNVTEAQNGVYTLRVIAGPQQSCSVIATHTVSISCPCSANADFTFKGCNTVNFNGVNLGGSNVIAWSWDFGDGNTSNLQSPNHLYLTTTAITRTVCLTITAQNSAGQTCTSQICKPVSVCPTPPDSVPCSVNSHYLPGGVYDYTAYFVNDIGVTQGTLCNYVWDFGDGNTVANTPNPSHTYALTGVYQVCLTATSCVYDGQGNIIRQCHDMYCSYITVGGVSWRLGETETQSGSGVYPNPFTDQVTISPVKKGARTVTIYDLEGRVVSTHDFNGETMITLDLGELSTGVYFLEISYADGSTDRQKLLKE